jgi:molecular chaperone GrpE
VTGNGDETKEVAPISPPPGTQAGASEPEAGGLTAATPACELTAPPPPTVKELEELLRQRDELRERLLRKHADFENFRKRMERDRQQARQDALAELAKALVPTLDNLERALSTEAAAETGALRAGVALVQRELLAVLESFDVRADHPLGAPFDPEQHQALSHDPVPGATPGTVVEVFAKGYRLRDRLLRPALVKVAKEASAEGSESPGEGQES